MDRFIAEYAKSYINAITALKSNMDRFIVGLKVEMLYQK